MEELANNNIFEHIDNLLDFQNDDVDENNEVDFDSFPPVWLEDPTAVSSGGQSNSPTARYEDIVQLEWLSNFVQDSLTKPKILPIGHAKRARSKRPRPATFNPRAAIQLIPPKRFELPKKKQKMNIKPFSGSSDGKKINDKKESLTSKPLRKCSHCEITETPQWRIGPNGPKSLCNACGVRYKSGRLCPEYRPAASPTFIPSLHSNSHRKVTELRKSKNEGENIRPELFQTSELPKERIRPLPNPTNHNEGDELRKSISIELPTNNYHVM